MEGFLLLFYIKNCWKMLKKIDSQYVSRKKPTHFRNKSDSSRPPTSVLKSIVLCAYNS